MMKNIFLLAVVVVLSFSQAFAQRGLEIGLYGGAQTSSTYADIGSTLSDFSGTQWGAAYGANLGLNISNSFGIRTGIGFSQEKFQFTGATPSYMRIPVLLKFKMGPQKFPINLLFNAGMNFGFMTNGNAVQTLSSVGTDLSEFTKNTDINAVMEAGVQINLSKAFNLNVLAYLNSDLPNFSGQGVNYGNLTAGAKIGVNYVLGF